MLDFKLVRPTAVFGLSTAPFATCTPLTSTCNNASRNIPFLIICWGISGMIVMSHRILKNGGLERGGSGWPKTISTSLTTAGEVYEFRASVAGFAAASTSTAMAERNTSKAGKLSPVKVNLTLSSGSRGFSGVMVMLSEKIESFDKGLTSEEFDCRVRFCVELIWGLEVMYCADGQGLKTIVPTPMSSPACFAPCQQSDVSVI